MMTRKRNICIAVLLVLSMFVGCSKAQESKQEAGVQSSAPQAVTQPAPAAEKTAPGPGSQASATGDGLVYLAVASAAASSFEETPDWAPKPDPMAPVDGDLHTRWSPVPQDNEWVSFDFGKQKTVSRIIIRWEEAYAVNYEILASDDGKEWRRVFLKEDGKGKTEDISLESFPARFIKIVGLERVEPDWGFSIWEFEMYGPRDKNPDDKTLEETFPFRSQEQQEELKRIALEPDEIVPSPGPIAKDEFHRGITYTSWSRDELFGEMSDSSLIYISKLGTGHISLMVVWYQDAVDAQLMYRDEEKTISDEALGHAINVIHKLGMKVMLKPHIDLTDEEMRTYIMPSEEWFKQYKAFIVHYAELAQKYNVELLCIGTELSNTTIAAWSKQWVDIIDEIRRAYTGPLIYAANWDEYKTVSFWDKVDYIGIDAYFPLTEKKDATKDELIAGWKGVADTLEAWLTDNKLLDKGIVFTEIGYDTVDGSNTQPWRVLPTLAHYVEDQEEQSDCLDSLMTVLTGRKWFRGIYWWNYFPRPDIGALGYTLRGKKGESVLSSWFAQGTRPSAAQDQ